MAAEDPGGETRGSGLVVLAFLVTAVLGGANFVGVRFSNVELPPFWGAGTRFALAAVILVAIGLALRVPFPRGRALVGASLFGLLGFGVFYALAYLGLQEARGGLASVILSSAPLWTFLLAVAQRQERFRWRGLVGALVAIGGILVMVRAPAASGLSAGTFLILVGAAVAASEANVIIKWFPKAHPVTTNAVAMLVGSVLLLLLSLATREVWSLPVEAATWSAFGYLVVLGSVGLFVLYLYVLKRWTASRASYVFVLFPVVALALSAWLEQEPVTPSLLLGAALVLAGVYVGAFHGTAAASEEPPAGEVATQPTRR
jgi:drug/metabolite transporter (DMT)-like permease